MRGSQRRINLPAVVLVLGVLSTSGCAGRLKPDSPTRPNLPMFVDPADDLKPVGAPAESWFACANLRAGEHEFGVLVHYLKTPFGGAPTIAISDVATGRYYLDEAGSGSLSATSEGFEVTGETLSWSANPSTMRIRGTLKSGERFDLDARTVGAPLVYGGTGTFPLFDNDTPTWEYALPTMETTGTITVEGKSYPVAGNTWFDRQWFRSMNSDLRRGTISWSWIALVLPSGEAIAIWDAQGVRERAWATVWRPDGTTTIADVELLSRTAGGPWTSAKSQVRWLSTWQVNAPGAQLKLEVTSAFQGQETFKDLPRVESVVHASGTFQGRSVTAVGFAEQVNPPRFGATP